MILAGRRFAWICSASLLSLAALLMGGVAADAQANTAYPCTQIIGFSQTATWYGDAFLAAVQDNNWELLWNVDGSIDLWKDPQYGGWYNDIVGPCSINATNPNRVVLTISNDYQTDPQVWADDITGAVSAIRYHYPGVSRILLQPVVGGPNDQLCNYASMTVRASFNDPYIDQGVSLALSKLNDPSVVAGDRPEVRTCDDYADEKGHLQDAAADAIGSLIGQYYASTEPGSRYPAFTPQTVSQTRSALAPVPAGRASIPRVGRSATHPNPPIRTPGGVHSNPTN